MRRELITWYTEQLVDNYIWVSDFRYNGLFKISKESGNTEFVGEFLGENSDARELHLSSVNSGSKIYFFPQYAKTIGGFDIESNEFFSIECAKNDNGKNTIINAFNHDGYLWLIPRYLNNPIQVLNVNENKVEKNIYFEKELDEKVRNECQLIYSCLIDGNILAPIHCTKNIMMFSINDKSLLIKELPKIGRITGAIVGVGQNVWISTDEGIYLIDKDKKTERICSNYLKEGNWIETFLVENNKIVCVPRWIDKIAVFDLNTMQVKYIEIDESSLNTRNYMRWKWRDFKSATLSNGILTISPLRFGEALFIDVESGSITLKGYEYPEKFNPVRSSIVYEVDDSSFRDFLSFV